MANAVNDEELQLRKRARRRLVGAVVLVLLAFLLLPRLLERQPKPVQKDVAIRLPAGIESAGTANPPPQINGLPPSAPATAEPAKPGVPAGSTASKEAAPAAKMSADLAPVPDKTPEPSALPAKVAEPALKPVKSSEPAPVPVRQEKPAAKPKAAAPTEPPKPAAKVAAASASGGEFDVQLGAFSKAENASHLVQKLKEAHFNVFSETVKTGNSSKTRVRTGPYPTREAAEKVRSRLIALKLTAGEPRVVRHE
jgi:DedD protein